jgi:hypothetical protein
MPIQSGVQWSACASAARVEDILPLLRGERAWKVAGDVVLDVGHQVPRERRDQKQDGDREQQPPSSHRETRQSRQTHHSPECALPV